MRILLATDGSPPALASEQVAEALKMPGDVSLNIVTVCPSAEMHAFTDIPLAIQQMVDSCRSRSAQLLNETAERCRSWASEVETTLLDGHPAKEILQLSESWKPDVIIMGARGLGAVGRFMMGSVSDRIAKQAHCSVLIVRENEQQPPLQKIVIAYDGSAPAEAVVKQFSLLPPSQDRSILVVGVIERIHVYGVDIELESTDSYQHMQEKLEPQLKAVVAELSKATPNTSSVIHYATDAAEDIVDTAEKFGADLIAVGHRSRSLFERFVLGSVAIRLLHHAPCSVWIERPL